MLIYAFNVSHIERMDIGQISISPKWDEIKIKNMIPLNLNSVSLQFDDKLIFICGGVDDKGSST